MSDYYPQELFHELVFKNIKRFSNLPALIHGEQSIKFGEIESLVSRIISNLRRNGITNGDIVLVCLHNSIWYPLIFLACAKIGAILSGINPDSTNNEMTHYLRETEAKMIYTTDQLLTKNKCLKQMGKVELLTSDVFSHFPTEEAQDKQEEDDDTNNMDSVLLAPFSSGTTGLPKCCLLTHRNFVASTYSLKKFIFDELIEHSNRKTLAFLPFYHASGFWALLICLLEGCTTYIMEDFHPMIMVNLIEQHEIETINIVPAIANILLEMPFLKGKCLSLRNILCGSSGFTRKRYNRFLDLFPQVRNFIQGYGMTEMVVLSHLTPFGDDCQHLGSCGQLLPGFEAKLLTEEEFDKHELLLKSDAIMKFYKNGTSNLDEDGWLHTGDIVTMRDNFYYIVDRKKDLIKVNGFQVSPTEIENTISWIPNVKEVAVIGIDDERCGQVPKAFIVLEDGVDELAFYKILELTLQDNLSSVKQLRGGIVFLKEMPKSGTGKVQKNRLIVDSPVFEVSK